METAGTYRWVVASAVVLAFTSAVAADGCMFPLPAYARMPAIPAQRAMIVYRGGTETLVVESAFETESPSVGWVLPLPAEPTSLEVAEAGMLRSLSICLKPVIVHDLALLPWSLLIGLVILVPFACVAIFSKKTTMVQLLAILLIVLLMCTILLPTAGTSLGAAASGISLKQFRRIGNYDVTVLRADNADALSGWLARNSLKALSDEQKPLVEDYIRRKWCFVVAKLRREGNRAASPHPIRATFPAERPIYPMKLTALAGSTTRVELFVVADARAAADGFECVASDTFTLIKPEFVRSRGPASQPFYYGRDTSLIVGSPAAGELMWEGCTVTKLSADLAPSDMDRDVRIEMIEAEPYQQTLFSPDWRRDLIICVLLGGEIFLLIGLMIVFRHRPSTTVRQRRAVLAIPILALIAAGAIRLAIPVVPVITGSGLNPFLDRLQMRTKLRVIEDLRLEAGIEAEMAASGLANLPRMMKEVVGAPADDDYLADPITGEPMRYERSPGNFSARRVEGKLYICFYDLDGREYRALCPYQGPLPEEKRNDR